MAVKLKHLQNLNEGSNIFHLIVNIIFGEDIPNFYDESKQYVKGDVIIDRDDRGNFILREALQDTTGPFKPEHWTVLNLNDVYGGGELKYEDIMELIVISTSQPQHEINVVWFDPKRVRTVDNVNINFAEETNIIIETGDQISAQDEEPVDKPEVVLWLDYEEDK